MPFEIKKVQDKYKLFNLSKKQFVKAAYKTKQTAINAGKNFMKYRNENPLVRGNKILNKKKSK